MSQQQRRLVRTTTGIAGLSLIVLCVLAGPSSALQDPGPTPPSINQGNCSLARVGTQYVHCDNLTGNGDSAPSWIPEL